MDRRKMIDRRIELQKLLERLLQSENVYFQRPQNTKMQYPCIMFERSTGETAFADNDPYRFNERYRVTVIDRDPDNPVIEKIARLRTAIYDRHFNADGLNHDVFNLYVL